MDIVPKVSYERTMLEYAYLKLVRFTGQAQLDQLSPTPLSPDSVYDFNAWLECFLLHARNLYDFFIEDPRWPDDVSALHFFDNPAVWQQARVNLCPYICKEKSRLQGLLAHLTYRRLDYEQAQQKNWDCGQMLSEMNEAWQEFISALPPDRQRWFI
jgi:hypothetical protein